MKVVLRLYKAHDYDLYLLLANGHEVFSEVTTKAIRSQITGEEYRYSVQNGDAELKRKPHHSNSVKLRITDPDVLELLSHIKSGKRTGFIKSAIRASFGDISHIYTEDGYIPKRQKTQKEKQDNTETIQTEAQETDRSAKQSPFIMKASTIVSGKATDSTQQEQPQKGFDVFTLAQEHMV